MKCIAKAKDEKIKTVLILEDDAVLVDGFKDKLQTALNELPEEWNALWLNGTETVKAHPISSVLKKVRKTWGTFGYVVNESFYDVLIKGLSEVVSSADEYYTSIQSQYNVYATIKPLVKHRMGVSDIAGKVLNYQHLA